MLYYNTIWKKSQSKDPAKYSGTLAGLDRILERCYNRALGLC